MTDPGQESLRFPRIALVSDLLPQASRGGDLAIYRLLGGWPSERLAVLHSAKRRVTAETLPGVAYHQIPERRALERARRTRFGAAANLLASWAPPAVSAVHRGLEAFSPDAVLTVAHDFVWLSAAEWCQRTETPLHVIVHDDWPEFLSVPGWSRRSLHRRFAAVLKQAVTRLCVSPGMAEEYERRYGVSCDVMMPCRGPDSPSPALRLPNAASGTIAVGYLGGLPLAGYSKAIKALADIVHGIDGVVALYGAHTPESLRHEGLVHPAIAPQAHVPWSDTFTHLTAHTSALFCPVSFLPEDATIMRMLFPSKLADYTACGLPIIIWGPEESSAVKWAKAHDHAAFVCTDPRGSGIAEFLQRISEDQDLAIRYARGALAAGEQDFSLANARSRLLNALTAGRGASRGR